VKVLLVGTGAYPIPPTGYGAIERVLFEYRQALERAGQTVEVLNEVHGPGALAEYRFALRVPSLLRRQSYDIVHVSTPVVANRLAGAGIPFVYTSHSRHWFWRPRWTHRWGFWLERRATRRAAAVVALTRDVEAAIRATMPPDSAPPVYVVPYGVSSDDYSASWDVRNGRRALGVGLIDPLKRWEVAAEALQGTGIELHIAGPVEDRAYADRLQSAGTFLHLLGEVDEARLRRLYAESDMLVHPSLVEVLPRAVLEAMASSLPVIGSAAVGTAFPEGRGGLIAPRAASARDVVQFFRVSAQRLTADPRLRREMGEAAREVAVDTYSWDRVVSAHLEVYRAVAEQRR
jgi:alpha-maltose-1-phosphate synthase